MPQQTLCTNKVLRVRYFLDGFAIKFKMSIYMYNYFVQRIYKSDVEEYYTTSLDNEKYIYAERLGRFH